MPLRVAYVVFFLVRYYACLMPSLNHSPENLPRLLLEQRSDGWYAVLLGRWGAADLGAANRWREVQPQLEGARVQDGVIWDLRQLKWLDHVGAQLLWNHWGHQWPAQIWVEGEQRTILERSAELTQPAPPIEPFRLSQQVDSLGRVVLQGLDHAQDMLEMVGQLLFDLLRLARNPSRGPWRDFSGHLYRMGAMALPITALVGFLIGVVLAYLMSLQLQQFGAESFIVNILGISIIRELGPMLAAILVAGRSGSAITAQIGVMRVTEELDAMRVMGIPHGFRLVMPRAMALAVAMPLISVWTILSALAGGMLVADVATGISPAYFAQALPAAVDVGNLVLAVSKSVVFGVLIALIGCHWGLRVEPNTQSLGEGTTASVVSAITMVIVVDAIFAVAFKNIGI
jgi:phospholipid/cholesterol/gamma-HCH transport system permease protein